MGDETNKLLPFVRVVRLRCSCWKSSVRAPKVRSCFEFASDLRDVAALKARACKFVSEGMRLPSGRKCVPDL